MKILTTLALTCLTGTVMADTTLVFQDEANKQSMKMEFAHNMMKITSTEGDGTNMIYNATDKTFTMMDSKDKKYYVMGEEDIKALTDVGAMMEKMMEKQLAEMPAEQREMMRNMLAGAMKKNMPKQLPLPEYSLTGKSANYNGFDCQIVLKKSQKEKSEFCVTEYAKLGMSQSEYATIATLQKTVEALTKQFGQDKSMNFMHLGDFIPVKFDQDTQSGTLSEVSHTNISVDVFSIPTEYSKIDLPFTGLAK